MLMNLGCEELVMFCGWLDVISPQIRIHGMKCSLCAHGVYSCYIFLMVLHEEQMSVFT